MTAEDDRAIQYLADQATIVRKRQGWALGLTAPAENAARVRAAWAPLRRGPDSPLDAIRAATPPVPTPPPPLASAPAYEGEGPPPGDLTGPEGTTYLDTLTGDLYRLE